MRTLIQGAVKVSWQAKPRTAISASHTHRAENNKIRLCWQRTDAGYIVPRGFTFANEPEKEAPAFIRLAAGIQKQDDPGSACRRQQSTRGTEQIYTIPYYLDLWRWAWLRPSSLPSAR
jgi:hypothetical protein